MDNIGLKKGRPTVIIKGWTCRTYGHYTFKRLIFQVDVQYEVGYSRPLVKIRLQN